MKKRTQQFIFLNGFYLIELLTTISIIAILISVSLPFYSAHIIAANRLEALHNLMKLSILLEEYHFENHTYMGATFASLHFKERIAHQHFEIHMQLQDQEYGLTAKALGEQALKDTRCGNLILTSKGEKQITGFGKVEECW